MEDLLRSVPYLTLISAPSLRKSALCATPKQSHHCYLPWCRGSVIATLPDKIVKSNEEEKPYC